MKTTFSALFLLFAIPLTHAQTATNWNVLDCSGVQRELFADLDAGKTAVIVWVMPCSQCVNGALTAQAESQSALASHPNKVVYYLNDDYGNFNCGALNAWAAANGITEAITINDTSASMKPYGEPGMPKIVVAAGSAHTVYYNKNYPAIVASELRDAIALALAAPVAVDKNAPDAIFCIYPQPADYEVNIPIAVAGSTVEISGIDGRVKASAVEGLLTMPTFSIPNGIYLLTVRSATSIRWRRLVVLH